MLCAVTFGSYTLVHRQRICDGCSTLDSGWFRHIHLGMPVSIPFCLLVPDRNDKRISEAATDVRRSSDEANEIQLV